jgi:hypothetical protein
MSDTETFQFFPVPEVPMPRLAAARLRYAEAQAAFDRADSLLTEQGPEAYPAWEEAGEALYAATLELEAAELEAIRK